MTIDKSPFFIYLHLLDISCLLDKLFSSGNCQHDRPSGLYRHPSNGGHSCPFSGTGAMHLNTYNNGFNELFTVVKDAPLLQKPLLLKCNPQMSMISLLLSDVISLHTFMFPHCSDINIQKQLSRHSHRHSPRRA